MKPVYEKLIDMVNKGVPDKEIMRELGVKTKTTLKRMYYDALVEAGKVKDILTGRGLKKAPTKEKTLSVSKRGTVLLGRKVVVDDLGFHEGDKFTVSKRKDSIILRKEQEGVFSQSAE